VYGRIEPLFPRSVLANILQTARVKHLL